MIQPLEEIFENSLFNTSIRTYWQVPKYNPTLRDVIEVRFERFDVQHEFGRDDNFLVKYDNYSVLNLYNFYGWFKMSALDRLMHCIQDNSFMDVYLGEKSQPDKNFRDNFYPVEAEYYYYTDKDEAIETYAYTKAKENNNTDTTVVVEEKILDMYPELFV